MRAEAGVTPEGHKVWHNNKQKPPENIIKYILLRNDYSSFEIYVCVYFIVNIYGIQFIF